MIEIAKFWRSWFEETPAGLLLNIRLKQSVTQVSNLKRVAEWCYAYSWLAEEKTTIILATLNNSQNDDYTLFDCAPYTSRSKKLSAHNVQSVAERVCRSSVVLVNIDLTITKTFLNENSAWEK